MDVTTSHIRNQIALSLTRLIDDGLSCLPKEELVRLLEEFVRDLKQGGRTATFRMSPEPVLTLSYPSPRAVDRDLASLKGMGSLLIDVDPRPPRMQELEIHLTSPGLPEAVVLSGRVIQETSEGVVLQFFGTESHLKIELSRMAKKIALVETLSPPIPAPNALRELGSGFTSAPEMVVRQDDPNREKLLLIKESPEIETEFYTTQELIEELLEVSCVEGYAVLEVKGQGNTMQLLVHHGELIDLRCDPARKEDSLEELLSKNGDIVESSIERARSLAMAQEISVGECLVDLNELSHPQLLAAIRARLTLLLRRAFLIESGSLKRYVLQKRPPSLLRSSLPLIVEIVRFLRPGIDALTGQDLLNRETEMRSYCFRRRRNHGLELGDAGFDARELRLLNLVLQKTQTYDQIIKTSPLSAQRTIQALLLFEQLRLLERSTEVQKSWEMTQFIELEKGFATGNPFEILGVHWSAYDDEVATAFEERSLLLQLPPDAKEEHKERLATMREKLEEARRALSSREKRKVHRDRIADSFAQQSALRIYEQKADANRVQKNIPALIESLERIVELKPSAVRAKKDLEALKRLR